MNHKITEKLSILFEDGIEITLQNLAYMLYTMIHYKTYAIDVYLSNLDKWFGSTGTSRYLSQYREVYYWYHGEADTREQVTREYSCNDDVTLYDLALMACYIIWLNNPRFEYFWDEEGASYPPEKKLILEKEFNGLAMAIVCMEL